MVRKAKKEVAPKSNTEASPKGSKKSAKGKKDAPAGQGYDPTPFYKRVPKDYVAVQTVKKTIEYRGRPIAIDFDTKARKGSVTIEDIAGNVHTAELRTAMMFDALMFFMGEYYNLSKFRKSDKTTQRNMLDRGLTHPPKVPVLFRTAEDDKGVYVVGVMSDKWVHVAAEDYLETAKSVTSKLGLKANFSLKESDGIHGGEIVITPKLDDGVISPRAVFDFGKWDGYHAVRGIAGGKVLACSNQMTIEVRGAMGKLNIGSFAKLTEMHSGTSEKFETLVEKVMTAIGDYANIVTASKKVALKSKQADMILQYYTDKNVISKKTMAEVQIALKDDEIQQVPNTMFGFAMALSYVGTHNGDVKDGVKSTLGKLCGEILVVSQDAKKYWDIIKKHTEGKPVEAPKEEAPAKEETPEEEAPMEVPAASKKRAKKSKK
jgi:hypothetical protein